jgi:hypothetical protein
MLLTPEFDMDDPYICALLDCVANTQGRQLSVPQPETREQEETLSSVIATVRAESDWLTAMSLLVATRFGAAVLKSRRVPETMLDVLRAPAEVLGTLDDAASPDDWLLASEAVSAVSQQLAGLMGASYAEFIGELPSPWLHCLSDIPLELMDIDGDLLAYRSALSRTPITPGSTPLLNYWATDSDIPLPDAGSTVVVATPFDVSSGILDILVEQLREGFPLARLEVVSGKSALTEVFAAPTTAAVVYFGHASYDAAHEETVLHLDGDTFGTFDVRNLERVPPLVLLIGCGTAGAGSTLGSFGTALLVGGARLVVGTSYPVRQEVGVQFLGALMRQVVAAPRGRPMDLARAALLARRNVRFFSDILVLAESARLEPELVPELIARYATAVGQEPSDPERANLIGIEARLLAEVGAIERADLPPAAWGIVPYPAFFSVMGMPWTTLRTDELATL